ncbi:hypothetical protein [Brachyspira pilosicoli]|uniref:hypothetical protein n=1 Tax=Brachyspira pilosicoli TaxID=52584 RepID=UPI000C772D4F|nr:hypothetical protein [Brachyspira pilosicoli]PLV62521.1 hypothetical protein BPSP16_04845 [Brachyspira pilosicoli SP16]
MIIATIQGAEEGFEHTTVINGKLVKGEDENEAINKLYEMIPRLDINDDEGIVKIKNGYTLCYMKHEKRDISNRRRTALIIYNNEVTNDEIEKTLKLMELDYKKWQELHSKYKTNTNIKTIVAIVIIVAIIFYFINR